MQVAFAAACAETTQSMPRRARNWQHDMIGSDKENPLRFLHHGNISNSYHVPSYRACCAFLLLLRMVRALCKRAMLNTNKLLHHVSTTHRLQAACKKMQKQ